MFRIVKKEELAPDVYRILVTAPAIAERREPGQFVMLLNDDEEGERYPLTIADADPIEGTITLVVQAVGKSTRELCRRKEGDTVHDVLGPLGKPTAIEPVGTVACIGGGIGVAPVYPIAEKHRRIGNQVLGIIGARNQGLLILEEEMRAVCHELFVCTDDGSYGEKGFVSDVLQRLLQEGRTIDEVVAIGPVPMMRAVCEVTRPYDIRTWVSLNPVMVDGTGMCGGCRVYIDGQAQFACVDGPEFDGHHVDFDALTNRQRMYREQENIARRKLESADHTCRLEASRAHTA